MAKKAQSTAVKKAWSAANKLHKAILSEGMDTFQSRKSTPGLARRYNSLMKKGLVPQTSGKTKIQAYGQWLDGEVTQERTAPVSSKETKPNTGESGSFANVAVDFLDTNAANVYGFDILESAETYRAMEVLENLSQTCKNFRITPHQLVAHANMLEQLQVLDTTCVQNS